MRTSRRVADVVDGDGTLKEGRVLTVGAVTNQSVSPHLYASRTAGLCYRLLWEIDASIYIGGPVISAVGSWNGNIAIEGTIRVLKSTSPLG